jgi:hypothetical protein
MSAAATRAATMMHPVPTGVMALMLTAHDFTSSLY